MHHSTWAPQTSLVVVGWLLTLASLAGALTSGFFGDRPGVLLFGVGTVALAAAAAHGTLLRPRLAADTDGLRVRTLSGNRLLSWSEVELRLVTTRRLGRDVPVLEVESGDLVVLGRIELGTDPRDVYDELRHLSSRE